MEPFALTVALPIFSLIALFCLPSRIANRRAKLVRNLVTTVVGVECLFALSLTVGLAVKGVPSQSIKLIEVWRHLGLNLDVYVDGAASLMLMLVSFVGFVVSRFSIRFLDGERMQGRYFRWLGFTIGAVSLMVVAGNLLLFVLAWVATSFGLHQLLLHYRHRGAAHRAAWTKFAISRCGDALLIGALVLTYNAFGTFELTELFSRARDLATSASQVTASHVAIGWLLVLGAVTKSAQFPFHTWLPDTMETPTPVSALMHAGIVNAGGYLIIRMSPLVALAPTAMIGLAVIGAFTACFAGVVMMTQTSVKRSLAYSTIAQMGFMMLQCGCGAFSAAMLHILAHSLYKAHAFLGSGSVVSQALATTGAKSPQPSPRLSLAYLLGAAAISAFAHAAVSSAFDVNVVTKPGGVVLALVVCLASTTWGWRLLSVGEVTTMLLGMAGISGLCLAYTAGYLAISHWLQATTSPVAIPPTPRFVLLAIALAFCALFSLHLVVIRRVRPNWLNSLRAHAANGFYIDTVYRRLFIPLARS
ncbi:MAG: hypothetical protein KDB23_24025 [Planctomycetales bacterium]|nr:hypothetical protein [Planctomycetales bacterium]